MKNNILLLLLVALGTTFAEAPVTIEGNTAFSKSDLMEQLNLPDEFESIKPSRQKFFLLIAKTNLEIIYRSAGHFNARFSILDSTDADGKHLFHQITIEEGVRFRFSEIVIDIPDAEKLLLDYSDLEVYPLKRFDQSDITADLTKITRRYRENGYLHVRPQHALYLDSLDNSLKVIYTVNPGSLVKFGEIRVECKRSKKFKEAQGSTNGISSPEFIQSMWRKKPGEIIDNNYFDNFRSKLLGTRLFSQVILNDSLNSHDPEQRSIISVKTTEKVPGSAKLRLFFEQIYGFGASGELRYKNFAGRFHEGWTSLIYSQNKKRAAIGYANPLLFNTPIRFENELSIQKDSLRFSGSNLKLRKTYIIQNKGDLYRKITDYLRLNAQVKLLNEKEFYQIKTEDLDTPIVDSLFDTDGALVSIKSTTTQDVITERYDVLKIKLETGLYFDFTDSPIIPENGVRFSIKVGNAGTFKSDERYSYSKVETKGYKRLTSVFQLAGAIDYGLFFSSTDDELEYSSFYQGGSRSVRGYGLRTIGPETSSDDFIKPTFVRGSAELRITPPFKSTKDFQVVPYFDWAQVWDQLGRYPKGEETALGVGLRYKLQILTIRVDYTFKKDLKKPFDFTDEDFEGQRLVIDLMQAI